MLFGTQAFRVGNYYLIYFQCYELRNMVGIADKMLKILYMELLPCSSNLDFGKPSHYFSVISFVLKLKHNCGPPPPKEKKYIYIFTL